MSLISVIVPCYNRDDIIHETIESVIGQTYGQWELILVDDGSTDSTFSILEEYARKDSRIHCYRRPVSLPKGANACRNYGLSLSKGEYIKWVDSDDLLLPESLALQLEVLLTNHVLKACFGQGVFFNAHTRKLEERWSRSVSSDNVLWDYIRNNVRWPVGGPLWRKNFFPVPPFHEELKNSQEWLMHGLQLLQLGTQEYTIIDDVVYLIRRGNERMSSRRNSAYYFNQAKARAFLLKASLGRNTSIAFKLELLKQICIFSYHASIRVLR